MNHYIKPALLISALLLCIVAGAFIYGWTKGLIIHIPQSLYSLEQHATQKKTMPLHWWNNNRWNSENSIIISSSQTTDVVIHILNKWLLNAQDVGIIAKKVTIQSAMLSKNNHELFISFDRSILDKEQSIYEKLQLINGILKTIHGLDLGIIHVRFLVHHKPINDTHLDFNTSWNILQSNL